MNRMLRALGAALALFVATPGPGRGDESGLSAEERRIDGLAAAQAEGAIALLERVVNIPSATENLDGVRRVGAAFREEFDRLGFRTRWAEMPAAMKRAGHLIAEHPGTTGKRVLLIGHLDTVLQGPPFRREGGRATGPGVVDMKSGDVILLFALKVLGEAGALDGRQVIAVLHGDEEDAGIPEATSRADLREAAARSDLALAFEEAIDRTATVARRGVSTWELRIRATTGHSSGILGERLGAGAIFEAARALDLFRAEVAREKDLTINPSVILGGSELAFEAGAGRGTAGGKTNVIPDQALVRGDLRFLSAAQRERAKARMREVVASGLPRTSATLGFLDEYPAMAPEPRNYELLRVLDGASRDLGLGPVAALDPGRRGAGDLSFVADRVAGLDGLGADGGLSHAPGEYVALDSLAPQIRRAALLIYRLTR